MMVTHLLQAELHKPEALDHAAWAAIADPLTRLKTAVQADDRPLIVGCAKELVEATARVVLSARGHPAGSETAFTQVRNAAHQAIEYQPGGGLHKFLRTTDDKWSVIGLHGRLEAGKRVSDSRPRRVIQCFRFV